MRKNPQRHCEQSEAIQLLDRHGRGCALAMTGIVLFLTACTPTVQVQAPDKPIEINLNVNIEHRIKVEIEKDVKDSIAKNKDIF
jgi:hypothetical protein